MNERTMTRSDHMSFWGICALIIALAFIALFSLPVPADAACIAVDVYRSEPEQKAQPPVDKWGDQISPRESLSPTTGGEWVVEHHLDSDDPITGDKAGQPCNPS